MHLSRFAFCLAFLLGVSGCAAPKGRVEKPSVTTGADIDTDISPDTDTDTGTDTGAEAPPSGISIMRVGLLLPLSAPQSGLRAVAQSMLEAAQLGLFDAYNSPPILLIVHDTKGTREGAMGAARDALDDGVQVILGPVLAASARAAHQAARAVEVPVISFSSDRTIAGNGLYTLGFPPEDEIARIVRYAAEQNLTRMAAFLPRTNYGSRVRAAFLRAAEENAIEVHAIETYTPEIRAASAPAQRLADFTWRKDKLAREQARLRADILRMEDRFLADDTGAISFEGAVLTPRGARGGRRIVAAPGEVPPLLGNAVVSGEFARLPLDLARLVRSSELSLEETAMLAGEPLAFTLAFVAFVEAFRHIAPVADEAPAPITPEAAALAEAVDLETNLGDTGAVLEELERFETFGAVPYDAVLLAEGLPLLSGIAQLLPSFDITRREVRFLGTGLWENPALQRELPLMGSWFAAPDPAAREALEARFRRAYDRTPTRIASLAYDAVSLVAALVDARGRFDAAGLHGTDFRGLDGVFRFTRRGSATRALAIIENRRNARRILNPARVSQSREEAKSPEEENPEQESRAADTP